jgi:hypothetical protein
MFEALVSLAIGAALLVAVAAAYNATASAMEMNDQFFRATQTARVSINQIMAEVRACTGGAVEPATLTLTAPGSKVREYRYDSAARRVTMRLLSDAGQPAFTLVRDVGGAEFRTDGATVSMTLRITIGENQVTLTGSSTPRRTVTFN